MRHHHCLINYLVFLTCLGLVPHSLAGGFDNSGRPFGIIYDSQGQPNEARVTYAVIRPKISADIEQSQASAPSQISTNDSLVPAYSNREWALRVRIDDDISCALRHEAPFRALIQYADDTLSYETTSGADAAAPIDSKYQSESLSMACRYLWQRSEWRYLVFGGPVHQRLRGAFSSDLSDEARGADDNLEVELNGGSEWGYLAGVAVEIPEIAFRAYLHYHSEIDYRMRGYSLTPFGTSRIKSDAQAETRTPQSVLLGLQSGIADTWLAYGEFRWSEWSRVSEIVVQDSVGNPSLSLYRDDTLDLDVGLIHAWNDRLALGVSYQSSIKLGADLPNGIDATSLRDPQGKRQSFLLGSSYKLTPQLSADFVLAYTRLDEKRLLENNFSARVHATDLFTTKLGISWFY